MVVFPLDTNYKNDDCTRIAKFLVFKSSAYAIYYQGSNSFLANNNILVENQIGVFSIIIGPSSLLHVDGGKRCSVEDSLIIGQSPYSAGLNCGVDADLRRTDTGRMNAFAAGKNRNGRIGLVWPNFVSFQNGAPVLSW